MAVKYIQDIDDVISQVRTLITEFDSKEKEIFFPEAPSIILAGLVDAYRGLVTYNNLCKAINVSLSEKTTNREFISRMSNAMKAAQEHAKDTLGDTSEKAFRELAIYMSKEDHLGDPRDTTNET